MRAEIDGNDILQLLAGSRGLLVPHCARNGRDAIRRQALLRAKNSRHLVGVGASRHWQRQLLPSHGQRHGHRRRTEARSASHQPSLQEHEQQQQRRREGTWHGAEPRPPLCRSPTPPAASAATRLPPQRAAHPSPGGEQAEARASGRAQELLDPCSHAPPVARQVVCTVHVCKSWIF